MIIPVNIIFIKVFILMKIPQLKRKLEVKKYHGFEFTHIDNSAHVSKKQLRYEYPTHMIKLWITNMIENIN